MELRRELGIIFFFQLTANSDDIRKKVGEINKGEQRSPLWVVRSQN